MTIIKKIQVTAGVFWVEVPEAQVYVLCGCPADSVKHLRKLNLIEKTEINKKAREIESIEKKLKNIIDSNVKNLDIYHHICRFQPVFRHILNDTVASRLIAHANHLGSCQNKDGLSDNKTDQIADEIINSIIKKSEMPGITAELIGCICQDKEFNNLIQERLQLEVNGDGIISCETGPNVILLSDELRQNGKFANLSEFPVLQMLYNQGMDIPGHPNNTGANPILIGAPAQINAQKEYIRRGNYGLVSEEEITSCGIDEDVAKEMMKIKLYFASNNIKESDKLLGTIEIENEQVEIKNGVYIRRLKPNKFELEYKTETVTVDLNLKDGQKYEPAYPLNFHQIEHEYFSVIHSGEGDGSNMNRPCMSSILMYQGKIYLIDAGPNIFDTLYALGISVNTIEGIFHTHIHDDHFAGIAELMSADHKIKYYSSELVSKSMRLKLGALLEAENKKPEADDENKKPDDYFNFCPLELNHWNDLLGLQVMPVYSPHPVETNIFFFRTFWENGWKQYAHLADITSFSKLNDMKVKEYISEKNYNKILEYYLRPADIKKIDAGAGEIHGVASDFKNDRSGKILLSHFSETLSNEQKEIGSGAPFGTTDVLIPATGDYLVEKAFEYLHTFFFENKELSDSEEYQLRTLTSNTIEDFSPESFLIKEGDIPDYVYLILTGNVEKIQTEAEIYNILSAGALIGELPGFIAAPSFVTYRSVNFVKALQLPVKQYTKFIKDNGLDKRIEKLHYDRKFCIANTAVSQEGVLNLQFSTVS